MKEDFQKFMELVNTDEALQKKLKEAGKNYDGEHTEEAVFQAVLEPIAKEAGFSFTLDDMKQFSQELNLDEMAQVSGGDAYGASAVACLGIGGGLGAGGGTGDNGGSGGLCAILGLGWGSTFCFWEGESNELMKRQPDKLYR